MTLTKRLIFPLFALILTACPFGPDDDYEFEYETIVSDMPANLVGINSEYDDYNSDLPFPYTVFSLFFSSNRPSEGQYFDITLGRMDLSYHEKDDLLDVHSGYPANLTIYENTLLTLIRSSHNQLGPHTFAGPVEFSYFFYADDLGGDYDIRFAHYLKSDWLYAGGTNTLHGPDSLRVINSDKDELYPSIPEDLSSLYFCSNRSNDIFDIYSVPLPEADSLHAFFKDTVAVEPELNEILSSDFNDKCPYIYEDIMVFTSDREGGFGGFDLYFSRRVNGTWTAPVNFGPKINTEYDEYRPILISFYQTQNDLMIFSSNRPGGLGGFDLYILNADSYLHP
jgi:hypothetical protein